MQALCTAVYGLWLIGSGVYRYMDAPDGKNALGFGIFTGVLALIGAALFKAGKPLAAKIITAVAILFVLGFFVTMIVKGTYPLSVRIGSTIALSILEIIVLFRKR
jgi:uncharacterized Tic20 family protein